MWPLMFSSVLSNLYQLESDILQSVVIILLVVFITTTTTTTDKSDDDNKYDQGNDSTLLFNLI